jgi:hypothetical protein
MVEDGSAIQGKISGHVAPLDEPRFAQYTHG